MLCCCKLQLSNDVANYFFAKQSHKHEQNQIFPCNYESNTSKSERSVRCHNSYLFPSLQPKKLTSVEPQRPLPDVQRAAACGHPVRPHSQSDPLGEWARYLAFSHRAISFHTATLLHFSCRPLVSTINSYWNPTGTKKVVFCDILTSLSARDRRTHTLCTHSTHSLSFTQRNDDDGRLDRVRIHAPVP